MKPTQRIALLMCLFSMACVMCRAQAVRATELVSKLGGLGAWRGAGKLTVEFRKGDELPVTVKAAGDFIETTDSQTSTVTVKRTFWLQLAANDVRISLDGTNFKPLSDVVAGELSIGASADETPGLATGLQVLIDGKLKP